jgi:hypothetical protein
MTAARRCWWLALSVAASSCAGAVESSKLEDSARRNVPVPICLKPLQRRGTAGVVPTLKPEDYWSTLMPSYDTGASTVDRDAPDCSGRQLLMSAELLQAEGSRTGPIKVADGDVAVEQGPDGFKVVWLRTHKFADGTAAGLLGLVRAREAYAEVYAVGLHRGSATRSRFAFERLGPEILVTATDDGCTGVKPNQTCETTLVSYLLSSGQLVAGARFALDRIQYGQAAGVGAVQYRLTATPVFQERSIRLVEQVVIRDSTQTEIRKSDLERTFQLKDRGRLVASGESLWAQVVGGSAPPPPPPPPPPPKAPK